MKQLVNNSGTTYGAKLDDFPELAGWDRVLATNVKALFYLTSGLAPLLERDASAEQPGRVINISSVAGLDPKAEGTGLAGPDHGLWSYNTSKVSLTLESPARLRYTDATRHQAAANHLTSQLAVTLGPRFITYAFVTPPDSCEAG